MSSGIYQIRNLINNHIYIGSAKNLKIRKRDHFNSLKAKRHINNYLQHTFDKYGEENFVFETLIICHPEMLLFYEQQFIDEWKPEYNLCPTAGNCLGRKHSEKTKRKISGTKRKNPYQASEETRKKQSLAHIGKQSNWLGKTASLKSREKMRNSALGRRASEVTKKKMSLARTGRSNTLIAKLFPGFISPDGIIYRNVINLCKFCKIHNLNYATMWRLTHGITKQSYGWTCYNGDNFIIINTDEIEK